MFSAPAAKHHPGVLATNRTIRLHGCLQPRAAHLVDGHGRDVVRASGPKAICRAGFCPKPAWSTQPIKASSTTEGSMPSKAVAATLEPRSVAEVLENPPRKRPMGERTAERITVSDMNPFYIRRDP